MTYTVIVFAGPSAIGKTHTASCLMDMFPGYFKQAKLYTTRPVRAGALEPDRISVPDDVFQSMVTENKFAIHAEFGGNRYGYTVETLNPERRHLLVNTWPGLVPRFADLPQVILVGMQAPNEWEPQLTKRMLKRGDSPKVIERRKELIRKDIQNLESVKSSIEKNGMYKIIEDDNTASNYIIPFIAQRLSLQAE